MASPRTHFSSGQANAGKAVTLPLAIMTSGDTHDRTVALLKDNTNFGMAPDQITLMKQEKVASLHSNKVTPRSRRGWLLGSA